MDPVRVLLVDDEVSSAEVLGLILAEEGYLVATAADGKQALSRLEEVKPHILVTDFMMPVMNGAELVKAVRATAGYENIPVLLISGAPEAALRSYKVNYQAFLRKPFGLDEFLFAVRLARGQKSHGESHDR